MTREQREQLGALAADPKRWAEWGRTTQREMARAYGVELLGEVEMRIDGVPGVVLAAHERQRMWDTQKVLGGLPESATGQLVAAMVVDAVGGGTYDVAMRRAGIEREALSYPRTSEPPKPYDIAMAARRAGGAR